MTRIRRRRGPKHNPNDGGPNAKGPNDDGVIAIIVALSLSTFLLGFAALAVDLGTAYTRKAELQSIADQLALAGANGLPDITHPGGAIDQITRSLTKLCQQDQTPGLCPTDGSSPSLTWATDHDPSNGEISFLTDPDGDTNFSLADTVSNLATPSSAVHVVLPPSTVQFGLAGAFGYNSAVLHQSATARVGTPLGLGLLPFALTPQDLTTGQFCVSAKPNQKYLGKVGFVQLDQPVIVGGAAPNRQFDADLTLVIESGSSQLSGVQFFMENSPDPLPAVQKGGSLIWTVTIPAGAPSTLIPLWATGTQSDGHGHQLTFRTGNKPIKYTGNPAPNPDLCQQTLALTRGFVKLARPGAGTGDLDTLTPNIRSGPLVDLYPGGGLVGSVGSLLNCVSDVFRPASTCLSPVIATQFSNHLTAGLLTGSGSTPGRLIGSCTQNTITAHNTSGVDASNLFSSGQGLIDVSTHGSGEMLKNRLTGQPGFSPIASAADRGWITSKALHCPRLAVMPVIDENPLNNGGNTISKFRYVWIDDDTSNRGLNGTQTPITSFRGYVIDPGFLPTTVAGSPTVGPLLGGGMPKEALLVSDLSR